ncbi:MAG: DUF1501 domain-containing protein [Gammaproteobacteria bacterium]|nr:DUF1501 domain-containing protein [Gammaproteobacteria bacterium]
MKRRDFVKAMSIGGAFMGMGISPFAARNVLSAEVPADFPVNDKRVLVNINMDGGPDFRHLLVPKMDSNEDSYAYQYWKNRATAHSVREADEAFQERWDNDFFHMTDDITGVEFGILNNSGWLKTMWEAGNVAIVNNALGSRTRDHAYSLLVLEQGDPNTGPHDLNKSGWGGRLGAAAGLDTRIVSLTGQVRRFCYGPHPSYPNKHMNNQTIQIRDSRNFGLYTPDDTVVSPDSSQAVMSRSLQAYYAAKRQEMDTSSPYYKFMRHESDLRELGEALKTRLETMTVPPEIESLYDSKIAAANSRTVLNGPYLGRQIRNLWDCFAAGDILNFQVASMEYTGWDSHKRQKRFVEQKFEDMFGAGRAFDTLYSCLPDHVTDNLVFVFSGEFGRQLRANGDGGTDHGRGNSILVIGKGIKGGLYGDMFPEDELQKIDNRSPDITGKTSIEHVFGAVCDWVAPGSGDTVFPNRGDAMLEEGVDSALFSA